MRVLLIYPNARKGKLIHMDTAAIAEPLALEYVAAGAKLAITGRNLDRVRVLARAVGAELLTREHLVAGPETAMLLMAAATILLAVALVAFRL